MSRPDPSDLESESPGEPHKLVCGLCETVLDQTHPDRASADEAADDHVPEAHPDHPTVVVLAVPRSFLEERQEDALAIAVGAQQRVSRRLAGHGDET